MKNKLISLKVKLQYLYFGTLHNGTKIVIFDPFVF